MQGQLHHDRAVVGGWGPVRGLDGHVVTFDLPLLGDENMVEEKLVCDSWWGAEIGKRDPGAGWGLARVFAGVAQGCGGGQSLQGGRFGRAIEIAAEEGRECRFLERVQELVCAFEPRLGAFVVEVGIPDFQFLLLVAVKETGTGDGAWALGPPTE